MRIITQRLIIVLFPLMVVAVCFGPLGHCQEKMYRPAWKTDKYKSQKECMDSFGAKEAAEALEDGYFMTAAKMSTSRLTDYFTCRAMAKYDNSECSQLTEEGDTETCIEDFNNNAKFIPSAFSLKNITPEMLSYCNDKDLKMPNMTCKKLAECMFKNKDSCCAENDINCKALIKLDVSLSAKPKVKDQIYFIKAIRDNEIKNCSQIQDKIRQRNCKAYIKKDVKMCDEDENFKKIKLLYCQYYSKQQ